VLADLGRSEDALAAIAEAVARYRELAAARHSTFLERLADSLISLGIRHTEREEFDAAVFADREAVAIYAALCRFDSERYRDSLEQAVEYLVIDLREVGHGEQEIADERGSLLPSDDY
jgi:hypothetical protein